MKTAISVIINVPLPPSRALSWAFACLFLLFHQDYFEIDY